MKEGYVDSGILTWFLRGKEKVFPAVGSISKMLAMASAEPGRYQDLLDSPRFPPGEQGSQYLSNHCFLPGNGSALKPGLSGVLLVDMLVLCSHSVGFVDVSLTAPPDAHSSNAGVRARGHHSKQKPGDPAADLASTLQTSRHQAFSLEGSPGLFSLLQRRLLDGTYCTADISVFLRCHWPAHTPRTCQGASANLQWPALRFSVLRAFLNPEAQKVSPDYRLTIPQLLSQELSADHKMTFGNG